MSEIRLFRLREDGVEPILGSSVAVERSLQTLIERHAEALLGIRVLASEYSTTKSYGGRIDTLGIDESGSPVIIEYKRALNENVINQGLFYLGWLLDHRADFKLLVLEKLGASVAAEIEWGAPRLVCIAGDFTKYDQHAIHQMPSNIDLVRYRRYGDDLLLLEQIATSAAEVTTAKPPKKHSTLNSMEPDAVDGVEAIVGNQLEIASHPRIWQILDDSSPEIQDWYAALRAFALALGDGVHEHAIDRYVAFRGLKNFAYVRFQTTKNRIRVDVGLDAATIAAEAGFISESPGKGRWPHLFIDSAEDVERALPLIARSYRRM